MTPSPQSRLGELVALSEKATPGPWEWNEGGRLFHNVPGRYSENVLVVHDPVWRPNESDRDLIVAAVNFVRSDLPSLLERISSLEGALEERDGRIANLMHVIDRDRYVVAHGVTKVEQAVRAREWAREGRGPYEWDDDDYRKEFGLALDDIRASLEPLRKVAWDKSDCTTIHERVIAAKGAAADLLKEPIGKREMIDADLFGDPRDKRIAELEAALMPFAVVAGEYDDSEDDGFEVWQDAGPITNIRESFRLKLFRRASQALSGPEESSL